MDRERIHLTPGPLTTMPRTRPVLLRDRSTRVDARARVRQSLPQTVRGGRGIGSGQPAI